MAMTIDERPEKLIERHEALTQTVELFASDNRAMAGNIGRIMQGIARLLHIAEIHEQRSTDLEDDRSE